MFVFVFLDIKYIAFILYLFAYRTFEIVILYIINAFFNFYRPYANRWSKTMIGYGPEDTHFVIELTYNYGIKEYETGNDFKAITIRSKDVIERARANDWPMQEENGKFVMQAPGGYKYHIINEQSTNSGK